MDLEENNMSVSRLLLKIAVYIGPAAYNWMSIVFSRWPINPVEMEILERTFSMGLYSDELLELSCSTALVQQLFRISEFPFLVEDVRDGMYN